MASKKGFFFASSAGLILALSLLSAPMPVSADEDEVVPIPIPATPLYNKATQESQMIQDVNRIRIAAGLPPLTADPRLGTVARSYAHEMGQRRFFGHRSPEGVTPSDRLDAAEIDYRYAGENIAFVQDENEAMQGFLQSAPHRANILDRHYTHIGVGVIEAGSYGTIYVQEFSGS